jgi:hypothetical protein
MWIKINLATSGVPMPSPAGIERTVSGRRSSAEPGRRVRSVG